MCNYEQVANDLDDIFEEVKSKRTVSLSINKSIVGTAENVAKLLTKMSGSPVSLNAYVEKALTAYVKGSIEYFEERYNISPQNFTNPDEKELERIIEQNEYYDLVTHPAQYINFLGAFLRDKRWSSVRMANFRMDKIKWFALYVGYPQSAITHYIEVDNIVADPDDPYKKIITFKGDPIQLPKAIPLGTTYHQHMRPPRYTTIEKLLRATTVGDLLP